MKAVFVLAAWAAVASVCFGQAQNVPGLANPPAAGGLRLIQKNGLPAGFNGTNGFNGAPNNNFNGFNNNLNGLNNNPNGFNNFNGFNNPYDPGFNPAVNPFASGFGTWYPYNTGYNPYMSPYN